MSEQVADISGEVYESDRPRLCAQALVLRENGFLCKEGLAYFVRPEGLFLSSSA